MKKNLLIAIPVMIAIGITAIIAARYPAQEIAKTPAPTAIPQQNSLASTSVPEQAPTPDSADLIRLAWFYKPPDSTEVDLVVKKTDFFILTHKDEGERSDLKTRGVTAPFSQYLLFLVINDPGDCEENPSGNQVAYQAGDFCQISQMHPDWFLLDESGNRIQSRKDSYYMDPGNEGFRAFWLQRARELQETYSWDNIFLDNVEGSRAKIVSNGGSPVNYPDDESYQKAVEGFLDYIRQNYFGPRNKPIYANIVSVDDERVWDNYLEYLDGAMMESFATDWSDGYRSRDEWEQQMQQAEDTLAKGKTLILVAQGEQDDLQLQNFAFASYLLIANGNAYFRYTHSELYRELWLYENYNLNPGKPLGDRYKDKGGWRRDFENGYVTVNPKSHEAEIAINP